MAYTIGALEVVLRTDLDQFTGGMRRAADAVDQANNRIGRSVRSTDRSVQDMQRSLGGIRGNIAFSGLASSALLADNNVKALRATLLLLPAAIGGTGFALGVKSLISYADAASEVRNRIAVVTKAGTERIQVEQEIYKIAQDTRTEVGTVAQLYARTAQSAQQLGRSQSDVLRFTEAVAKTAAIGGARREEAQAAAIQLAQGLASNRLQGDELRSVLENNVALAQILAQELAGGSIGKLREMGSEGLITAQAVLDAVLRRQEDINRQFAQMAPTIAQGFTVIGNALTKYVGDIDKGIGASKALFESMQGIANSIPEIVSGFLLLASVIPGALIGRRVGPAVTGTFNEIRGERTEEVKRLTESARIAELARAKAERRAGTAGAVAADFTSPAIPAATLASTEAVGRLMKAESELKRVESELAALSERRVTALGAERQAQNAVIKAIEEADLARQVKQAEEWEQKRVKALEAVSKAEAKYQAVADARAKTVDRISVAESAAQIKGVESTKQLERERANLANRDKDLAEATARVAAAREEAYRTDSIAASRKSDLADRSASYQRVIASEEDFEKRLTQARQISGSAMVEQTRKVETAMNRLAKVRSSISAIDLNTENFEQARPFAAATVSTARTKAEASASDEAARATKVLEQAQRQFADASAAAAQRTEAVVGATGRLSPVAIAAATGLTILRNVGSSLFAFLGGPWGVALTAATAGFLIYQQRAAEAAAETQRLKTVLDGLPAQLEAIKKATEAGGGGIQRSLVDALALQKDAEKAAKDAGKAFKDKLDEAMRSGSSVDERQRLTNEVAASLGTTSYSFDLTLSKMKLTTDQMSALIGLINSYATSARIDPKIAAELSRIGEDAMRSQKLVDQLASAINGLKDKKVEIQVNVTGMDLSGLPAIGGPLDKSLGERATRDAEQIQAEVEAELRVLAQRAALDRELSKARRRQKDPNDAGLRTEEEALRLRRDYPNLPQAEIDRRAKDFVAAQDYAKPKAEADKFKKTIRELREEAIIAGPAFSELDRETLRYARSAGLSEQEAQKFIAAVSDGRLDQAPEKFRAIREQLEAIAKARFAKEIGFDFDQLGRTSIEQAAASRLKSANLPVDFGSEAGRAAVFLETLKEAKAASTEFASTFVSDLRQGKTAMEALTNALNKLADRLISMALDAAISSLFKSLLGVTTGTGNIGGTGGLLGGLFDSGGVAGVASFGPKTRLGSITVADSGLGPRHFPVIVEKGEAILTKELSGRTTSTMTGLAAALASKQSGSQGAQRKVDINISLDGANGDRTIERIARAAVISGLRQYDSSLPERVTAVNSRFG